MKLNFWRFQIITSRNVIHVTNLIHTFYLLPYYLSSCQIWKKLKESLLLKCAITIYRKRFNLVNIRQPSEGLSILQIVWAAYDNSNISNKCNCILNL